MLGEDVSINPLDVLRWPGVSEVEEVDLDATAKLVLNFLDNALDQFLDGRRREGDKLKVDGKLDYDGSVAGRQELIESVVPAEYRSRLAQ